MSATFLQAAHFDPVPKNHEGVEANGDHRPCIIKEGHAIFRSRLPRSADDAENINASAHRIVAGVNVVQPAKR